MKKYWRIAFLLLVLISLSISQIQAQSSYVLPYPSAMPGSSSYKLHLVWEEIMKFWHFGDFGQFNYNLKQSDKYLVEARTLFGYKQYLFAYKALEKSNVYFVQAGPKLKQAKKKGKNIEFKEKLLKEASQKHIEELEELLKNMPEIFIWTPEKIESSNLEIHKLIQESIIIRKKYL